MVVTLVRMAVLATAMVTVAGTQRTAIKPRLLFVSTTGDDTHEGDSAHPYRTIQRATDSARPGDTVTIRGGTYFENVKLTTSGNFFNRQIVIQAAANEKVILDGSRNPGGSAIFDTAGQDHLVIKGITVQNSSYSGIAVNGSYRVRVEDCHTEHTPGSGIIIDKAHDVVVSHCDVSKACMRGGEESVSIKRSAQVVFENSTVHDTFHEGIDVKEGSIDVLVRRNSVHHVERQGLYADAWDADTGRIRFEGNVIHDCMVGLVACTETGGFLHDVEFVNNVVYDCRGPGMMVAKWGNQRMNHRIRNVTYLNNTVVNCGGPGKNGIWAGGMLMENDQAENVTVLNNIFSGNGFAQFRVTLNLAPKHIAAKRNLIDGVGENITSDNLVGAVHFVDPVNKDFRLAPDSLGIGAGVIVDGVGEFDAAGNPRVRGQKIDIGAYQR